MAYQQTMRQFLSLQERVIQQFLGGSVTALPPDTTVIVTADHGGHGRDHGTERPEDVLIPWIAWGAGVEPGKLDAEGYVRDWLVLAPVPLNSGASPASSGSAVVGQMPTRYASRSKAWAKASGLRPGSGI